MDTPFYTNYLLRSVAAPAHRFAFVGVPHDAATSLGNPGGRFGPQALREALLGVFGWRLQDGKLADQDEGMVDLSAVEVADAGDVALSYYDTQLTVEQTYTAVRGALEHGYVPLMCGGDHGVTFPAVKALHDTTAGRIGVIQLDAHCDLMSFSDRQGHFSGSSGMRRSLELDRLNGPNLVQVGLRGYTTVEQFEIGERLGVRRIGATRFAAMGARAAAEQALAWAADGTDAIYLTIDLDAINPGEAPGTGWPEPGGLTGQQAIDFLRVIAPHVAALDIAELNPLYDTPARTTALLAARLVLDFVTVRVRAAST
jgi:agmatinase